MARIRGTDRRDTLKGTDQNDTILGFAAADLLIGRGGNDTLKGGDGNDTLKGGNGNDKLYGGRGRDTLIGNDGKDKLFGEDDRDLLNGGAGNDHLDGGSDDDRLSGGADKDTLVGGGGADDLNGGSGTDTASYAKSPGSVRVNLETGIGLDADAQGDTLSSIENLIGSRFGDLLEGDDGRNVLDGRGGDDIIRSGGGADVLKGGSGSDTANYASSLSAVHVSLIENFGRGGDAEGDTFTSIENLHGSGQNDILVGNNRDNVISGNGGDDTIVGARGADRLSGQNGADTFVYTSLSSIDAFVGDIITDFTPSDGDKIDLSRIDADIGTGGNQAFTFVGEGFFSDDTGQVAFNKDTDLNTTTIIADVGSDGNLFPDFTLTLLGLIDLEGSDFIL